MIVEFYKNNSSPETVNKQLTQLKSFAGSILNPSEVVDPVIQVPLFTELLECNYIYIPEFKRYYFASPNVINNSIIEFSMHCDVLKTYAPQFTQLEAIIERQEGLYNLYQTDHSLPLYVNKNVQYKRFNNSIPLSPSYILITAG